MLKVIPFNATYVKVQCSDFGIEQELQDFFSFMVPGYKFMPSYKSGIFDGKIRLYDLRKKTIYKGLVNIIKKFAENNEYPIEIDDSLNNSVDIQREEVVKFMNALNLHGKGNKLEIREYQYEAVFQMLNKKRSISLAATAAGKSLMLMAKIRFHELRNEKVLLIVPSVNLVEQMYTDFQDYSSANGWSVDDHVHTLYSGKEKVFDSPIIISTWQSLLSIKKSAPSKFKELTDSIDVLLCDEAHQYKATSVSSVVDSFTKAEWRTGTSGTLDGTQVNELTLTGMLGPVFKVVSAREMMDAGQATPVEIKVLVLKHPTEYCKALKGMMYQEEINQIVSNPKRCRFIANLALACTGNTLILYNFVERHGSVMNDMVREGAKEGRNVYFIHGGVDADERERIRKIVETENNAIILATASLFSTGTNIPSLENIIFAAPSKSSIRIRQSIGRGIRLKDGKTKAKIFDIADDYRYKSWTNTTYKHMEARLSIYVTEQFDYTVKEIDFKY